MQTEEQKSYIRFIGRIGKPVSFGAEIMSKTHAAVDSVRELLFPEPSCLPPKCNDARSGRQQPKC